jgi:activating signal cointegrator 1
LVAGEEKRFETRSWGTAYSGRIAIHASKIFHRKDRAMSLSDPIFLQAIRRCGFESLSEMPLGCIIATVHLKCCRRVGLDDGLDDLDDLGIPVKERPFGNYAPRPAIHVELVKLNGKPSKQPLLVNVVDDPVLTADAPTVPGWYWYRTHATTVPYVIEVLRDTEGCLTVKLGPYSRESDFQALDLWEGLWSGPISPP